MSTTTERLDKIEAENAALKAELARLKDKVEPPKPPPPPPIIHNGTIGSLQIPGSVGVRTIPDPPPPPLTAANVRELRRMVGVRYPRLISMSSAPTEQQALQRFSNALWAVGKLHGTEQLDEEHTLAWWVDHARSIVDQGAGHADFDGSDFTAAAMALNVWHREWTPGSAIEFGLMTYVPYGSSKFTFPLEGQWRETLRRGAIIGPNWAARAPGR